MNIQARKIEFIQEFLEIQNEDVILHLEALMKIENDTNFQPMTEAELNKRINQSENDFKNGEFISNDEMLNKYS